jgi:hypothetical protein
MLKSPSLLESHPSYISSQSQTILEIIGGSHLYGIATKESDIDYRGIFLPQDKKIRAGFQDLDTIVTQRGDTEGAYYSLRHFMKLLRKTNTQAMELLYAPVEAYAFISQHGNFLRENRFSFIDSEALKKSFRGYMIGERMRAYGESKTNYGSLRRDIYNQYGFIPKSVGNLIRIMLTTKHFFESGEYVIRPIDIDESYHNVIMEIRNDPQEFKLEQIKKIVDVLFAKTEEIINNSDVHYEFDLPLAATSVLLIENL